MEFKVCHSTKEFYCVLVYRNTTRKRLDRLCLFAPSPPLSLFLFSVIPLEQRSKHASCHVNADLQHTHE
jgi:hypothetical protein